MTEGRIQRLLSLFRGEANAPVLDRARWESLENNEDWNERARAIKPMVEDFYPVLDVGAGTQYLRQLVGPDNYIAVDSVDTHGADYVVDLNLASLPLSALRDARAVTFLGVLEYLVEPEKHVADALGDGRRVVLTYTPTDMVPEISVREANGWKSHMSLVDLDAMISRLGFEVVGAQRFRNQVLLALGAAPAASKTLSAPKIAKKRKIVISGFFARGNAGDEALLQRIYETFAPHADIVCTVDRTGAYEGFWDWYPYNRVDLIHQGELARMLDDQIVGIHVGGGGLPLGFNGGQLAIAGAVGKPAVMTGIDDPLRMLGPHNADTRRVKQYIESFSAYEVRTQSSLDTLAGITKKAGLGADWAFDLPADDTQGETDFDGLTVVVRELPQTALDAQRVREYRDVFAALDQRSIPVRLLPFCPEDERYLDWIQPAWRYSVERHWWNPRRCKEIIARSRGVISIGRLHPLIFAAGSGTPALAIDIDTDRFTSLGATSKIADHAQEFAIPYFPSMGAFLKAIEGNADIPLACSAPASYAVRLDRMRSKALGALGLV